MPLTHTSDAPKADRSLPPLPTSPQHRRASLRILSRNIDQVVLGNLRFSTWYYSPYPDSVVLEPDRQHTGSYTASHAENQHHNLHHVGRQQRGQNFTPNGIHADDAQITTTPATLVNGVARATSASTSGLPEKPMLKTLHVCPYCFRYTPLASDYAIHISLHTDAERQEAHSAGSKSSSTIRQQRHLSQQSERRRARQRSRQKHNRGGSDSDSHGEEIDTSDLARPVPSTATKVYSHNGYTVWDVDGEVEKLYSQNLSLFGKLFLEQKSVFFDTGGFHYFVLTYCREEADGHQTDASGLATSGTQSKTTVQHSPGSINDGTARGSRKRALSSADTQQIKREKPSYDSGVDAPNSQPSDPSSATVTATAAGIMTYYALKHQVLGFFSKENLSWDSNNLACILVFPPYQHRSLGQLLMSVSYKLSGWEWEGSVIGGPEKPLSTMGRKSYLRFWSERVARFVMGQSSDSEGLKVFEASPTADDTAGSAITSDRAGQVKRRKRKTKGSLRETITVKQLGDRTGMLGEDVVAALMEMGVCELTSPKRRKKPERGGADHVTTDEGEQFTTMTVHRSKILAWAKVHGVDLENPVKEEGFLGEWALSEVSDGDE